jgi:hypothetical protein
MSPAFCKRQAGGRNAWSWIAGCCVRGAACWVLGAECRVLVLGAGCWCWVLGAGCWVLGAGCRVTGDGWWALSGRVPFPQLDGRCVSMSPLPAARGEGQGEGNPHPSIRAGDPSPWPSSHCGGERGLRAPSWGGSCREQEKGLSTQHPAPSTQHPAFSLQHSAPRTSIPSHLIQTAGSRTPRARESREACGAWAARRCIRRRARSGGRRGRS